MRDGIHRLPITTPFLVGRVNCYLIEDEPLTLIDTGPNSGKSLDELEQALRAHQRAIEDLELIVITHQHMDHVGLLEILARRSGADIAAINLLTGYLERFAENAQADDDFAEDLASVLRTVGGAYRAFGSSGQVTRALRDGDTLELRDRRFTVLHRPGHSPSDTIFWDEDRKTLLAGDHLLAHISSNPLVSRPLSSSSASERPRALIDYIDSMQLTRELPATLVLPGHGDPIVDHRRLIEERLRMHERRARKMLRLLKNGPLTGYEVAHAMWGNVAVTQAYLTLSEVLGHMDLLVRDGYVREHDDGDVVRFAATDTRSSRAGAA
jgi:glyoxylase-like metal-dependent hydrolase (beta-lactamase superfamily II)